MCNWWISLLKLPERSDIDSEIKLTTTKVISPDFFLGVQDLFFGFNFLAVNSSFAGKNSGTVKGTTYFECKPNHGVFVRHDRLMMDKKRPKKPFPASELSINNSPISKPLPTAASTPSYLKPTRSSRSRKN